MKVLIARWLPMGSVSQYEQGKNGTSLNIEGRTLEVAVYECEAAFEIGKPQ